MIFVDKFKSYSSLVETVETYIAQVGHNRAQKFLVINLRPDGRKIPNFGRGGRVIEA